MNGFFEGDSLLFRPKMGEILNFESFSSLEINLEFKINFHNLVLSLNQWHMLHKY
jgi:hypothetical protein